MLLIFLLYALFGSIFTAAKVGLEHCEPFFLLGSRMLIAGALLFIYHFIRYPQRLRVKPSLIAKLFLLGAFNIYLTNAFEFWGMQFLSSSKTSFIYSLSPFFSALLSYVVFKEKMGWKKWLGLSIGFLGFIPILGKQTQGEIGLDGFAFISWAEAAVMCAAISAVYGWVIMRQLVVEDVAPITANAYSMLIGGAMAVGHSLMVETWNPMPVFGSLQAYSEALLWMIVISSLICYNLYGYLLKKYSVTFLSFSGFTTPFFTAIFSWFIIGEKLGFEFYISAAIVFSGLFLFYQEELKKEGIQKKTPSPKAL